MDTSRRLRLVILLLVLGCTVGCDQASKHMARAKLSQVGSVTMPGGFAELTLAENPGSFLSLGAVLPEPLRLVVFTVGIGVGLILLLAYLVGQAELGWVPFLGLALVLAGGVSNLIDRVTRQGLVTDFILIRIGSLHTGIFNLADFVIVAGIAAFTCALARPTAPNGPSFNSGT
jgi:signal peptidase II